MSEILPRGRSSPLVNVVATGPERVGCSAANSAPVYFFPVLTHTKQRRRRHLRRGYCFFLQASFFAPESVERRRLVERLRAFLAVPLRPSRRLGARLRLRLRLRPAVDLRSAQLPPFAIDMPSMLRDLLLLLL